MTLAVIQGRKSSGSSTPTRTPDNLRAVDTVEIVLGNGVGPRKGLKNGTVKNVFIGDTPIQNSDESYNFKNFEVYFSPGAATDAPVKFRLGGQSSSTTVNVTLADTAVTRQTTSGQIDQLQVRIVIAQLIKVNDNGDQLNHVAKFKLEYKASSSGTWLPFFPPNAELTITGKTSTNYPQDYTVNVPRIADTYDIRVTKTSPANTSTEVSTIIWESFQTIVNGDKLFAGESILHIIGEATDQFTGIPTISHIEDGILCRMPNNYNPYTRTLSGNWDGVTWKYDWTQNPALIFNEICLNSEWGVAAYFPDIKVNKWDIYAGISICDALVDNGAGGTQPRWTFNGTIQEPRNGLEVLRFIAGIFGAIPYDGGEGEVRLKFDVDSTPIMIFTPENTVLDQEVCFNYTYTDIPTRHNLVTCTFKDPNLNWGPNRVSYIDSAAIARDGLITLDIVADGCIYRQEAYRRAARHVISAQTEKCIVTFKTNRMGLHLELFDQFLVCDPDMDWGISGRIQSLTNANKTVVLRDAVTLIAGLTYQMVFQTESGPQTVTIPGTNTGSLTQIVFTNAVPAGVGAETAFAIQCASEPSMPKPFRVVDIVEVDNEIDLVQITGLEVNKNKWAAIDSPGNVATVQYSRPLNGSIVLPPTALVYEISQTAGPGPLHYNILLNWTRSTSKSIKEYEIWASWNDDPSIYIGSTPDTIFTLPGARAGIYKIEVWSVSTLGTRSGSAALVTATVGHQGSLATSTTFQQTGTVSRQLIYGVQTKFMEDGQTITFDTPYTPFVPKADILEGGRTYHPDLNQSQFHDFSVTCTATTATLRAKITEAVGTVTPYTVTGWNTVTAGVRFEADKPTSENAWNNIYRFTYNVLVYMARSGYDFDLSAYIYSGTVVTDLESNDGSGFTVRQSVTTNSSTEYPYIFGSGQALPDTLTFNIPVTVDVNVPSLTIHAYREFAISLSSRSHPNSTIYPVSVYYETAAAPNSRSATTANNKVKVQFYLGGE